MNIVLATGIYPPDIGGPATYCKELAFELRKKGHDVSVITFAHNPSTVTEQGVHAVPLGIPVLRWFAYAKALKAYATEADIVYAFSSVSCGVPLLLSRLQKPKRVLRLGGDFFWERYTDKGGRLSLRQWHASSGLRLRLYRFILRQFHHIVFSTDFQQEIYAESMKGISPSSVIENALLHTGSSSLHEKHNPFRLLFMGRFVRFKNITALLQAMTKLPDVQLTIVGDGPLKRELCKTVEELLLTQRVEFRPPVSGDAKQHLFDEHDVLVLPSLTEISPNTALEARAAGLPVLLSDQTGLSTALSSGMTIQSLSSAKDIAQGVAEIKSSYSTYASAAHTECAERNWSNVCTDHISLFSSLV